MSINRKKFHSTEIGTLESMGMDGRGSFCPPAFFAKKMGHVPLVYSMIEPHNFKKLWTNPTTEGIIYTPKLIETLFDDDNFYVITAHQSIYKESQPKDGEEDYHETIREYNELWFFDKQRKMVFGVVYNDRGCAHTSFFCLNSNTYTDYFDCIEDLKLTEEDFASEQTPKVFILESNSFEGLFKTPFDLAKIEVDIDSNYNNDIKDMDGKMNDFVGNPDSGNGLCLLHGDPSGGKTSYIRHLIQTFPTVPFIFVPPSMVNSFSSPDFTSFLRSNKGAIMIIEDAESILRKREDGQRNDCVANLLQMSDGLLSDAYKLKIIATFNTGLKYIDEALRRKGRLHVEYKFDKLEVEKAKRKAKSLDIDESEITEPIMLGEIYNLREDNGVKAEVERTIGFN